MKNQRWVALLGVAWLCSAPLAHAQKVVVFELGGDRKERLRIQVEDALRNANVVQLVSLKKFKEAAAKKKLKGSKAMTAAALKKLAKSFGLDAAVEGEVDGKFHVRILDASGEQLWSKDLPVKGGLLSADHARKLAKAIAAAAAPNALAKNKDEKEKQPAPEKAKSPPVVTQADPEEAVPETRTPKSPKGTQTLPEIDLSKESAGLSEAEKETRRNEDLAEAHTQTALTPMEGNPDADLDTEPGHKVRIGPRLVTLQLGFVTTWRAYCSRPGLTSCRAYDALDAASRPKGDTVDFLPKAPYGGFAVGVEFFPFASFDSLLKGLGLLGGYHRGFSLTNVRVDTPTGGTSGTQVISIDEGFNAMAAFRYFFSYGDPRSPLVGYVGLKGGFALRTFEVDINAQVPLPGSHRSYPAFGADVAIPLLRFLRLEGSASYFLNPKAGVDEIAGYGDLTDATGGATGSGFLFEGGFGGELWGPIGYTARLRHARYTDRFFGKGQKWPCDASQCGGAAEETYTTVQLGVTASF